MASDFCHPVRKVKILLMCFPGTIAETIFRVAMVSGSSSFVVTATMNNAEATTATTPPTAPPTITTAGVRDDTHAT